jgi:heme A synthase
MEYFRWGTDNTSMVVWVFFGIVAGIIGVFVLASLLTTWRNRRKVEIEVARIERQCGLSDDEADLIVHVANKNRLNQPMTLYTSLRVFDQLVGREIETLMDSPAPPAVKQTTVALAYDARAKLFPQTIRPIDLESLGQEGPPGQGNPG